MVTAYETHASISANFPPLTNPSFYQNTIGTYNYRIGWHISCYHSIGTDDDIITDADVAQNFRAGRDIDTISNARRGAHTIPVSDGHLPSDHYIFAECCIGADHDSKGMGEKYGLWQPLVNFTIQISLEEFSNNGSRVVGEKY